MIIVAVLDGYSSSVAEVKTRHVVRDCLEKSAHKNNFTIFARKSRFMRSTSRKLLKDIESKEFKSNKLLCVGKSLGGKHIVQRVLNKIGALFYDEVHLITIDINWPAWNLNLNGRTVKLKYPVDSAINLYVHGKPRQQCGAQLSGQNVQNIQVLGKNHHSIIESKEVRTAINRTLNKMTL
jgi:hypothetical protein